MTIKVQLKREVDGVMQQVNPITSEECVILSDGKKLNEVIDFATTAEDFVDEAIVIEENLVDRIESIENRIVSEFEEQNSQITTGLSNIKTIEQNISNKVDTEVAKVNAQLSELANKGTTVEVIERVTKEEIDRQIADGTIANLMIEDNSITPEKTTFFNIINYIDFKNSEYYFRGEGVQDKITLNKSKDKLTYTSTDSSTLFFGVKLNLTLGETYTIKYNFLNSNSNGFDICTDAELGNSILAIRESSGKVEFTATATVMYLRLFIRPNESAILQCNMFKSGEERTQIKAEYLPIVGVNSKLYSWDDCVWTAYGDSITAISNGNGLELGWAKYVNNFYGFSEFYGRGVGGQTYVWNNTTFYVNSDGTYNSRDTNHTPPSGTTEVRGCFCSWARIKAMYPENIRHKINLVFIMGGTNDLANAEEATGQSTILYNKPIWSKEFKVDSDWVNDSQHYLGGDYDVNTFSGAIASTIMKFQVWCPNAVIVIGTPISRWYTPTFYPSSQPSNDTYVNGMANGVDTNDLSDVIVKVANYMATPCIDINRTCGINGFNWDKYMDGVHPYPESGKKMLARAVIGGLENILPLID